MFTNYLINNFDAKDDVREFDYNGGCTDTGLIDRYIKVPLDLL